MTPTLRVDAFTGGRAGPIQDCDEHGAVFVVGHQCPGPQLDRALASSVAVRAAYAFGDWPPPPDPGPWPPAPAPDEPAYGLVTDRLRALVTAFDAIPDRWWTR